MIVRCTKKLLTLLAPQGPSLVEAAASEDDWYANLLWHDRRKCLLIVHAGTLFPILDADVRASELRPFGRYLAALIEHALLQEQLPIDAFGPLDSDDFQIAKTASRHLLGVMNQIARESAWQIDDAGGLLHVNRNQLNYRLRRSLHTKHGDYRRPLDLLLERLPTRP